ncbi:PREDICTED: uncharacterized protein LOC109116981 [Tarenaya hassleriana]|uniref:uncharacterized protein LOC109116981 n=1 Tax=Tarenaya hassleriana TaxID=28532 RepID=UPI0008FD1CDD|nr:PREDICTED: uncharacterized protein LOC109116981 [Tarenaya hassleriana]
MEISLPKIIPIVFDGKNYLIWSKAARTTLIGKGLWSHVLHSHDPTPTSTGQSTHNSTADAPTPTAPPDPRESKWFQEDQQALAIIQSSLAPHILNNYIYCETTKAIWDKLKLVYGNLSNMSRIYEIRKTLFGIQQGGRPFDTCLGEITSLWAEYEQLRPDTSDAKTIADRKEQDKVFSILACLDGTYNDLVYHVLRQEKIPSMDECWFLHPHLKPQQFRGRDSRNKAAALLTNDNVEALIQALQTMSKDNGIDFLNSIVIDSGATNHMFAKSDWFTNLQKKLGFVSVANGDKLPIAGHGSVQLFDKQIDALYVPKLKTNLLSIPKLTKDLDCSVTFDTNEVRFQDTNTRSTFGKGILHNNLYLLDAPNSCSDTAFSVLWYPIANDTNFNLKAPSACLSAIRHRKKDINAMILSKTVYKSRDVIFHEDRSYFSPQTASTLDPMLQIPANYKDTLSRLLRLAHDFNETHGTRTDRTLLRSSSSGNIVSPPCATMSPETFDSSHDVPVQDQNETSVEPLHERHNSHVPSTSIVPNYSSSTLSPVSTHEQPAAEHADINTDTRAPPPAENSDKFNSMGNTSPPLPAPLEDLRGSTTAADGVRRSARIQEKIAKRAQQGTTAMHCSSVTYPIQDFCTYSNVSSDEFLFLSQLDRHVEPKSYRHAKDVHVWQVAMQEELDALERNQTWTIVDHPPNQHAIGSKWIYKIKYRSNGDIERHKARLVAQGYTQTYGENYTDTFAPVAKLPTVRVILSLATNFDWSLWQMDVKNAFLQGDLDEEIYMVPPPGYREKLGPNKVCKLRKSLYGLKQSPRASYSKLNTALATHAFSRSESDHSLFIKKTSSGIIVLLIYVDDIIITGNDTVGIADTKRFLHNTFEIKDLGELKYFLGIEVLRSPTGIFLSQRKYILDLLQETGKLGAKPAKTPLEDNYKEQREGELYADDEQYRRVVGKLIYLTITRPDLCFPVKQVSQWMHAPTIHHWRMVERILKYLKGTPEKGIWMTRNNHVNLVAYCDADWAGDRTDRKSTTGYCTFLGGNLVTWKSKKQQVVARSSAEAEYRAMANTACEIMWLKALLQDLDISTNQPVTLHCDSHAAMHIAQNPVFHERTKHIEVDCHFVREKISQGIITTSYTKSNDQLADIFTKASNLKVFNNSLSKIGVIDLPEPILRGNVEPIEHYRHAQTRTQSHITHPCVEQAQFSSNDHLDEGGLDYGSEWFSPWADVGLHIPLSD